MTGLGQKYFNVFLGQLWYFFVGGHEFENSSDV